MQKMHRVAASITWKKTDRKDSSEKVWRKVTTIFEKITTVMKISKARLIRLLLSPICMILKILAFRGKEFSLFISVILYILIHPKAFATELIRIMTAKIGQRYLIMITKTFFLLKLLSP